MGTEGGGGHMGTEGGGGVTWALREGGGSHGH